MKSVFSLLIRPGLSSWYYAEGGGVEEPEDRVEDRKIEEESLKESWMKRKQKEFVYVKILLEVAAPPVTGGLAFRWGPRCREGKQGWNFGGGKKGRTPRWCRSSVPKVSFASPGPLWSVVWPQLPQ